MFHTLVIVIVCIILSAFFSGMEIAFVASNKLKLEIDKKNNRVFSHIINLFTLHPGQYITTILVGNNIALVVYSLNMTLLIKQIGLYYGIHWMEGAILFDTAIATVILIFTSEFLPKAVVKVNPNMYMRNFAVPVYVFYVLLYPLARFTTLLSVWLLKIAGLKLHNNHNIHNFDRVDLTNLVEEAVDNEYEAHTEHEIKLFQNALDFSDQSVRDCMVPRVDIEAVDISAPIEELSRRFVESQYSRILVYESSIDNIVGYVNTKSLFTFPSKISDVLIKVDCVPESMPAQKLLTAMIKKKQSVTVVIDEFGGTAGLVSIEDVLEEIFGEIEDEHDSQDMVEKRVGDGEYVLSCRLEVDYLNDKYRLDIPESDEYDTLAGYIIFNNDGIPAQGDTLLIDNKQIKILKTSSSRVELARIKTMD